MAKRSIKADAEFLQKTDLHKDQLLHLQCSELHQESQLKRRRKIEAFESQLTEVVGELRPQINFPAVQTGNEFILNQSSNARVLPTMRYLVLMPNSTFEAKDYRDDKYFRKRASCLSKIGKHLKANVQRFSTPVLSITWRHWKEDERKREILIATSKFRYIVQLRMESLEWIQPTVRLVPNRNNLGQKPPDSNSIHYNFCLTEDAMHEYDVSLVDEYPNAEPAMILFQIWALQRGFWRGVMDVDDTSALLLYAYRTKRANARMTPLQVLTAMWKLLSEEESWVRVIPSRDQTEPQTVAASTLAQRYAQLSKFSPVSDHDPATLLELWQQQTEHFPVTLLDSSMRHNFCVRWRHHWSSIRREASLSLLDSTNFRSLFLETRRFWTRHDAYCRVAWNDSDDIDLSKDKIISTLRKALGNRAVDVQLLSSGNGMVGTHGPDEDSDEIPVYPFGSKAPTKDQWITLGLTVDSNEINIVDRGPPMEDAQGVDAFRKLWGKKAQLRRFKDGAVIYAVVWDTLSDSLSNSNAWQAEIVERVVQHIFATHFSHTTKTTPTFVWKDIVSVVDGLVVSGEEDNSEKLVRDAMTAHRSVLTAFDELSTLLREQTAQIIPDGKEFRSPLGLPLSIDAVEPLGPSLRYAELFPPVPHSLLGGQTGGTANKVSGAISFNPIEIQIRFGSSSKWPNDLYAIGAAKTAMLIELTNGLEKLKQFKGKPASIVTPAHADLCFKGYVWRIFVRADPELKLLRSLAQPSSEAAAALRRLTRHTVIAASHHTMVHAVYTSNPSSSAVLRLAKRWLSSHLLEIPMVALELMICYIYTGRQKPGTVFRGFERWLNLFTTFDWVKEPLIVDPQSHLSSSDHFEIKAEFHNVRGDSFANGPPLFIVSPCDRVIVDETNEKITSWMPYFLVPDHFERVVLCRAVALARRTHQFLQTSIRNFDDSSWTCIFHESPEAFRNYSVLLRVDSPFLVDVETSSTAKQMLTPKQQQQRVTSFTKSMRALTLGPQALRKTMYRNLAPENKRLLLQWNPVAEAIQRLRTKLSDQALFLYNELCPEVIAVVWRQHCHSPRTFSAVTAECMRPTSADGDMVVFNVWDSLREIKSITGDIISDMKIFDSGPKVATVPAAAASPVKKRLRAESSSDDESDTKKKAKAESASEEGSSSEESSSGSSDDESSNET